MDQQHDIGRSGKRGVARSHSMRATSDSSTSSSELRPATHGTQSARPSISRPSTSRAKRHQQGDQAPESSPPAPIQTDDGTLLAMTVLPPFRFDWTAYEQLGLLDDLTWYMDEGLEIGTFLRLEKPVYELPTRAFISTVTFETPPGDAESGILRFTFAGRPYALTIPEIRSIFGFPSSPIGDFTDVAIDFDSWVSLTGATYDSTSKASAIRHPAARLMHILLATSIFSRKEFSRVRKDEFQTLIFPFLGLDTPFVNFGSLLCAAFVRTRGEMARPRTVSPQHRLGNFITAILEYVGIDLSVYPHLPGTDFVDMHYLYRRGFVLGCTKDRSGFAYGVPTEDGNSRLILLPSPHLPRLRDDSFFTLDETLFPRPSMGSLISVKVPRGLSSGAHSLPRAASSSARAARPRTSGASSQDDQILWLHERLSAEEGQRIRLQQQVTRLEESNKKKNKVLSKMGKLLQKLIPGCSRPREARSGSMSFSFVSDEDMDAADPNPEVSSHGHPAPRADPSLVVADSDNTDSPLI